MKQAIRETQPRLVLALGQAGGRSDLSIERVAINVDDARIADNAGAQPVDTPVVADGLPASVSQTADTYVCNHVFYGLQHHLAGSGVRSGFMHIPYLPAQAARLPGQPSLPLATLLDGTRLALELAWRTQTDLRQGGGEIS
jgi:pyroglutamyl-peptidase